MTLIEELEQAADRAEERHRKAVKEAAAKGIAMLCDDALEAICLRKRVEHVKAIAYTMHNSSHYNAASYSMFYTLTGDL